MQKRKSMTRNNAYKAQAKRIYRFFDNMCKDLIFQNKRKYKNYSLIDWLRKKEVSLEQAKEWEASDKRYQNILQEARERCLGWAELAALRGNITTTEYRKCICEINDEHKQELLKHEKIIGEPMIDDPAELPIRDIEFSFCCGKDLPALRIKRVLTGKKCIIYIERLKKEKNESEN